MFTFISIIIVLFFVAAFAGFLTGLNILNDFLPLIAIAFGAGVVSYAIFKPKNKKLKLDLDDNDNNKMLEESFENALEDYNYIKSSTKYIKDTELKRLIQNMQKTAWNILTYLQKHPEKIPTARRFIDYYQDSAAGLLEKYIEIENTQLTTDNVREIKERTKETLYGLNNAYTEQFEKIINEQLLNMDAELKVMEQSIKADGYTTEKTTPKNSQDIPSIDNLDSFCGKRKGRHNMGFNQMKKHMSNIPQALFESSNTSILKRKLTAGALGIFFGSFGAHKFYLGKTFWGVLYLLFCWTGIPFIVGLVEGVRYIFMSQDEFFDKYISK
jgi:TM2 domain-containing membrane protein YozV/5-bromo-4-chloroindolyl phosphate hydrolysis protein